MGGDLRPQRLVHLQCHVRVFAGVLGGTLQVDLVKADLVGPLTAQVFEAQATAPQVALRQARQAVRLVDLKNITLQHGVMGVALDLDAMVGKHMPVIFHVLPQLGVQGVFKPRPEPRQHLVPRQLLGCAGVTVGQGDVSRFPGHHAQAHADDFCSHLVQRRRLCAQRHQLRRVNPLQPALEGLPGQHGLKVRSARWRILAKQTGLARPLGGAWGGIQV